MPRPFLSNHATIMDTHHSNVNDLLVNLSHSREACELLRFFQQFLRIPTRNADADDVSTPNRGYHVG